MTEAFASDWIAYPNLPEYPKVMGSIADDEDYTFEYLVNPGDVGSMALHMDWQEPWALVIEVETTRRRNPLRVVIDHGPINQT